MWLTIGDEEKERKKSKIKEKNIKREKYKKRKRENFARIMDEEKDARL